MNEVNPCPCCSQKSYLECCKIFHDGVLPETALQLMRSRYSAYALNLSDYIIETTHPNNPHVLKDRLQWKYNIIQFSMNTQFDRLEILDFKENGEIATVTFRASLTQNGRDATFTEKSYFEKISGRWLYLRGDYL